MYLSTAGTSQFNDLILQPQVRSYGFHTKVYKFITFHSQVI